MITTAGRALDEMRAVLGEKLGVDASTINEATSFADLGADSLIIVELLMELEDRLSTDIPEQDAAQFRTVGDVLHYLESRPITQS